MNSARILTLDRGPVTELRPIRRLRRARPWVPVALLTFALIVLVSAFPPRLADICGQDGALVCGP